MNPALRAIALVVIAAGATAETSGWTPIPEPGAPPAREGATSVWTGTELVVWGGYTDLGDRYATRGDGGRYDPATGRWAPLPSDGAPSSRAWHSAVWTGKEMIVWGGAPAGGEEAYGDGAAFDPEKNAWRTISAKGAPLARVEHAAVWTGTEMLIIAGAQEERSFRGGGRYDPASDTWRPLTGDEVLTNGRAFGAVWAGSEAILFGGVNGGRTLRQGGRYDPRTDTWRPISLEGAPTRRGYPGMVWTGSRVVVFGGAAGIYDGPGAAGGAIYDPATDSWAALPEEGAPAARVGHAMVWTGAEIVVWGGGDCRRDDHSPVFADGARWRPGASAWTPIEAAEAAPSARVHFGAHWTGSALLVWGGAAAENVYGDGGLLRLR